MTRNRLRNAMLGLSVALVVTGSGVFAVSQALAAAPTATPTILTGPASPTASQSAAFTYNDTAPGSMFLCSLDGGRFRSCPTSGMAYHDLSDGSHTFRVEAKAPNLSVSASASRTWSVDTRAPTVHVTFPTDGGQYGATGWSTGCTPPGICGTAKDASGVAGVALAIRQESSDSYWNGSSFASPTPDFVTATGTSPWHLPVPFSALADGSYSVFVRAADVLGNATERDNDGRDDDGRDDGGQDADLTFRIHTKAPPAPVFISTPDVTTTATDAEFEFTDAQEDVSLKCQLDQGPVTPCTGDTDHDGDRFNLFHCAFEDCAFGEIVYHHLSGGTHCLSVVAVDDAGNVSPPATFCWTVNVTVGSFGISGDATSLFYPGATPQPLNLVISNPFNFAIKVTSITITVQGGTTKNSAPNPGCDGPTNFQVTRPFSGTVTVPANGTASLTSLGAASSQFPLVQMPDLPVNQDACKNTTFHMSYTGTAVQA